MMNTVYPNILLMFAMLLMACGNKVEPSNKKQDIDVKETEVSSSDNVGVEPTEADADSTVSANDTTANEEMEQQADVAEDIDKVIIANNEPAEIDQNLLTDDLELTISASEVIGIVDVKKD